MAEIDNFWKEVEQLLNPIVPRKLSYRLYHDDNGNLLFYSMDDIPGNYIEIDQETFAKASSQVRVKNGKVVKISPNSSSKLVPSSTGTAAYDDDITIVVNTAPFIKWKLKQYESDN